MARKLTKAVPGSPPPPPSSKTIIVSRATYTEVIAALLAAQQLLTDMEAAGALRLPFPGHPAVVKKLRVALS